jgi:hypothetical protein
MAVCLFGMVGWFVYKRLSIHCLDKAHRKAERKANSVALDSGERATLIGLVHKRVAENEAAAIAKREKEVADAMAKEEAKVAKVKAEAEAKAAKAKAAADARAGKVATSEASGAESAATSSTGKADKKAGRSWTRTTRMTRTSKASMKEDKAPPHKPEKSVRRGRPKMTGSVVSVNEQMQI